MHRNVAFLCIAFLPLYVCVPCPIDTFNLSFCNHSAQLYRSRSPIDPDGFSELLCHSSESCRMGCASCTAESNADLINPPFSIPGRCHWPYNEMRLFNDSMPQNVVVSIFKHTSTPQDTVVRFMFCVAKFGKSLCFGVNIGIKRPTAGDTRCINLR